ncbi:MAG: hypothetical protein WCA91_09080 [Candidatus Acidiferrales bacterium]
MKLPDWSKTPTEKLERTTVETQSVMERNPTPYEMLKDVSDAPAAWWAGWKLDSPTGRPVSRSANVQTNHPLRVRQELRVDARVGAIRTDENISCRYRAILKMGHGSSATTRLLRRR